MAKAKKTTPKNASKGSKPARGSKADFVREQPSDLSAKEVVAKAKEAGLTLTENHVYAVRAGARKKAKDRSKATPKKPAMATRPKAATPKKGPAPAPRIASGTTLKGQLRQILKEMGMAEARKVIAEVEAAFAGK
jgi:hypothetical protein